MWRSSTVVVDVLCALSPTSLVASVYCTSHIPSKGEHMAEEVVPYKSDEIVVSQRIVPCAYKSSEMVVQYHACCACPNVVSFCAGDIQTARRTRSSWDT